MPDVTGQLDRLRSSVSVAFQASYLFDRSIADNVAYASDAPDGQRIEDALRASGLDGLVRERGADFTVGSKGKFLSGGEQRRVALSRAFIKTRRCTYSTSLRPSLIPKRAGRHRADSAPKAVRDHHCGVPRRDADRKGRCCRDALSRLSRASLHIVCKRMIMSTCCSTFLKCRTMIRHFSPLSA